MRDKESSLWVVYILQCRDESLYTGITNDLGSRIKAHANGQGAKYTKGRGPFVLLYQETCIDRASATKREAYIKKMSRAQKIKMIKI